MAFIYEIQEHLATISDTGKLAVELNIIQYGNKELKYDLRKWRTGKNGRKMQKGITLSREELVTLRRELEKMEL